MCRAFVKREEKRSCVKGCGGGRVGGISGVAAARRASAARICTVFLQGVCCQHPTTPQSDQRRPGKVTDMIVELHGFLCPEKHVSNMGFKSTSASAPAVMNVLA